MHVLGIDAGGSKTLCLLADAEGRIVAEGRGGGANLQAHGELHVEKVLHQVIDDAMADRAVAVAALCLGLAGMDREDERQIVRSILRRLGFKTHTLVVNDALIALVAGAGDAPGIVIIAGTGSIAYGTSPAGVAARAGGWGHILGDEGSGYWIGRRALLAVMRAADGRGPATALTSLLLRHFDVASPDQLVSAIYDRGAERQVLAATGVIVEQARAAGDIVAGEILQQAAVELTTAAHSVADRLNIRGDAFPIVLAGGMFRAVPWLVDTVTRHLREVAPRSTVSRLTAEPAVGAVRLALKEARQGVRIPPYLDMPTPTSA
jgi:N-acetylglucosamine kinase-like BadF-type ATPase